MSIELHCHTTASDGLYSPAELVKTALAANVRVLAVTDHDTTKSLAEVARLCANTSVYFIPGIELSTWNGEESIHLLGYFRGSDYQNRELTEQLESFQTRRTERAREIQERLKIHYGLDIDLSLLPHQAGASIGRANIARLIQEKYRIPKDEIFARFLGDHTKAFIPSSRMPVQEGIQLLKAAGATVILAHPGELRKSSFAELFELDFDGAECYYPNHSPRQTREFLQACHRKNRLVTCGSDDHGIQGDKKHGTLGSTLYDPAEVEPFLRRIIQAE